MKHERDVNRGLAVVTGASSGIGYELAKEFARHGFALLITSQSEKLQEAAESLQDSGVRVDSVQADLATYDGVEKVYQAIRTAGRPLEAVAINAGVGRERGFHAEHGFGR